MSAPDLDATEPVAQPSGSPEPVGRLPAVDPAPVVVGVGLGLLLVGGRLLAQSKVPGITGDIGVMLLVLAGMATAVLGYAAAVRLGSLLTAAFGVVAVAGAALAEVALTPALLVVACMVAAVKGGRRKEVSS